MSTRRTVRVAEVLRRELSSCLSQCLDLEDLLITISSIELPPDMKQAYVYVSTLNPELERDQALIRLNRHRREWQSVIGKRMTLKFTPHLIFRFDKALERGDRIMEILTELNLNTPEKGGKHLHSPLDPLPKTEDDEDYDDDEHNPHPDSELHE